MRKVLNMFIFFCHFLLVLLQGIIIIRFAYYKVRQENWIKIIIIIVPLFLWLLFGIGGIVAMTWPLNERSMTYYNVSYTNFSVLLFYCYTVIASILYYYTFIFGYSILPGYPLKLPQLGNCLDYNSNKNLKKIYIVLFCLLILDWYVRFTQIQAGVYFTWLLTQAEETILASYQTTSFLGHLQKTIWSCILTGLVYIISVSKRKKFFIIILIFQVLLIISTGRRLYMLMSFFMISISYVYIYRIKIKAKAIVILTTSLLIFFYYIGPVIQEARYFMRFEGTLLMEDPVSIPYNFLFVYVPKAVNLLFLTEDYISPYTSADNGGDVGSSLQYRMGAYAAYAASIQEAVTQNTSLLEFSYLKDSLLLLIPRFIYPEKVDVDSDVIVFMNFFGGDLGIDAGGTALADVFAYFHCFGIFVMFIILGFGYGFLCKFLIKKFNQFGIMLIFGIVILFNPTGDSFVYYLANLRNIVFVVIVINLILLIQPIFQKSPTTVAS